MKQKTKTIVEPSKDEKQLFELTVENSSLSNKIEELKAQVTTLQKQKGGYIKANNEYRDKLANLKLENDELTKSSEKTSELGRKALYEANVELDNEKRRNISLSLDLDKFKIENRNLREFNTSEQNEVIRLKRELLSITKKWWYKLFTYFN